MTITKSQVKGHKGTTVVFSIPNTVTAGNILSWDSFRFYTPEGTQQDENGNKYFSIPAEQVEITRDPVLYKELFIYVLNGLITAKCFFESESITLPEFGLYGDILFIIRMPPEIEKEIIIEQREVTDDPN